MGFFKECKLKKKEVTIQGETFTLTEPSALALTEYYDFMEQQHGLVKEDSGLYLKSNINTKVDFKLISYCLVAHFGDKSHAAIYRDLCEEITDFNDIATLRDAAEEVSGLKMVETDESDESSQEN